MIFFGKLLFDIFFFNEFSQVSVKVNSGRGRGGRLLRRGNTGFLRIATRPSCSWGWQGWWHVMITFND